MDREIKFRGWSIKEKRFLTLKELYDSGELNEQFTFNPERSETTIKLTQFTGLKDKNGKEIYEGDIVKWGHAREYSKETPIRIAEVKINPDIQFHSQVGIFDYGSFAYADSIDKDIEIIGNIFENPELTGEQK